MLQFTGPGEFKVWSMQAKRHQNFEDLSFERGSPHIIKFHIKFILLLVAVASTKIKGNYGKSRFRIAFGYSHCDVRLFRETK